jgi:SAM-dependent methyltransferase
MNTAACRSCGSPFQDTFANLGMAPLANALIAPDNAGFMEPFYPLRVFVCRQCFLVQVDASIAPELIFSHYLYFSSISNTWLNHCAEYVEQIVPRLGLGTHSYVVEVASNDGHLLKEFQKKSIPVLGVEPAINVSRVALADGVPTKVAFFGRAVAEQMRGERMADLIVANNVLAHVPDVNDFVAGLRALLRPGGTLTVEFPHLVQLIKYRQFDTIYHEHVLYLSLMAVEKVFARHGLTVFDVETNPVHGGSLRLYATHDWDSRAETEGLRAVRSAELAAGLDRLETYQRFAADVVAAKCDLLEFFIRARRSGKRIVGYSAAAKGISLLNYCGIGPDFIDYVVDRSPHKQGMLLPGSHLPIHAPERVMETKPDYLIMLAWNLRAEVMQQMSGIRQWGGRFISPIPTVEII